MFRGGPERRRGGRPVSAEAGIVCEKRVPVIARVGWRQRSVTAATVACFGGLCEPIVRTGFASKADAQAGQYHDGLKQQDQRETAGHPAHTKPHRVLL